MLKDIYGNNKDIDLNKLQLKSSIEKVTYLVFPNYKPTKDEIVYIDEETGIYYNNYSNYKYNENYEFSKLFSSFEDLTEYIKTDFYENSFIDQSMSNLYGITEYLYENNKFNIISNLSISIVNDIYRDAFKEINILSDFIYHESMTISDYILHGFTVEMKKLGFSEVFSLALYNELYSSSKRTFVKISKVNKII